MLNRLNKRIKIVTAYEIEAPLFKAFEIVENHLICSFLLVHLWHRLKTDF